MRRPSSTLPSRIGSILLAPMVMSIAIVVLAILPSDVLAQNSGQPVPRMVSIKASEANVRTGPGVDYPIRWVYQRMDMPVQVIAEFEKWRKIRDWEGDEGWVHHALLSSRRTVIVTAVETTLRRVAAQGAPAVARLAQGMVARAELCEADWCLVTVQGYDGWLRREDVWGLEAGETLR
jgi:SH3-like domain-containing protein